MNLAWFTVTQSFELYNTLNQMLFMKQTIKNVNVFEPCLECVEVSKPCCTQSLCSFGLCVCSYLSNLPSPKPQNIVSSEPASMFPCLQMLIGLSTTISPMSLMPCKLQEWCAFNIQRAGNQAQTQRKHECFMGPISVFCINWWRI